MSAEGYPRNEVCAECGSQIVIHLSKKDTEYACNSDTRNDFHKPCRNWKAKGGQTQLSKTQKVDRVSQDLEDHAEPGPVSQKRPGPEADLAQSDKVTPAFHPSQNMPETSQVNEITATVNRKVGDSTILGLPAYENIDFRATLRAELSRGANVQQAFQQLYAEGIKAIDREIEEMKSRFIRGELSK